jgi:hypothetical protein
MPRAWLRPAALLILASPLSLAACATGSSHGFGGGGAGGSTSTSASTTTGTGGDITIGTGGGSGGGASVEFTAYAQTGKSLYEIDPTSPTAPPKLIGTFDCIGQAPDTAMLDLAVSEKGEIWGVSYESIYRLTIQGSTVHCDPPITLADKTVKFYGLTFAPKGTLAADKEVLIAGNTAGELWAVDENGALTQHGTFGKVPLTDGNGHDYQNPGKPWELSGDIVFLSNNGKPAGFATVRDCPNPPDTAGCSVVDTLIQIDMTKLKSVGKQSVTSAVRGQILKKPGCSGADAEYQQTLGIAAWDDKVYGFSHNGGIVAIDNVDGSACLVVSTPGLFWNGAGLTTSAPVKPPPG